MTVSGGQPTLSVDPEASLRAELTGAIAAAQIDIANAVAELARSGADSAALANQGQALQQLQRTVGSANLGSLLALRSDVTVAATSATALATQAISTATNAAAANTNLSPSQRTRANIETVQRDLFEKRVLDPYLQFASTADEEAYRKREREGDIAFGRSDHETARDFYNRALLIYAKHSDALGEANCLKGLGKLAFGRSDYDAAQAAYEEALPKFRQLDEVQGEANCLRALGDVALWRSDYDAARTAYEDARRMGRVSDAN